MQASSVEASTARGRAVVKGLQERMESVKADVR